MSTSDTADAAAESTSQRVKRLSEHNKRAEDNDHIPLQSSNHVGQRADGEHDSNVPAQEESHISSQEATHEPPQVESNVPPIAASDRISTHQAENNVSTPSSIKGQLLALHREGARVIIMVPTLT
jgi:hypothetical protein